MYNSSYKRCDKGIGLHKKCVWCKDFGTEEVLISTACIVLDQTNQV